MIQLRIVSEMAGIVESWNVRLARWLDGPGEWDLCLSCERSEFAEASGLMGLAPHSLMHGLFEELQRLTELVETELAQSCTTSSHHDGSSQDAEMCQHRTEALELVKRDLRDLGRLLAVGVEDRVSRGRRERLGSDSRYVIRSIEQWIGDVQDWVATEHALAPIICGRCLSEARRGESLVVRLPHDLRHELFVLFGEIEDDFEAVEGMHCDRCKGGSVPPRLSGCHHRRRGSALVHRVWLRSRLAVETLLMATIDPRRRAWVVDEQPFGAELWNVELEIASSQPALNLRLWRELASVASDPPRRWVEACPRAEDDSCYRSEFAWAACPTMHWPHWLLHGVVEKVLSLRAEVLLERLHEVDDAESTTVLMLDFDAWIFPRLHNLDLLEHTAGMAVRASCGDAVRRQMGLRVQQ